MIIEDKQGNNLFPHTMARFTYLDDGTTIQDALGNLNITWEALTGKPTTFPSTIAEVSGLQTALDGKAPTHAHPYAPNDHTHTGLVGTNQPLEIQEWIDFHATGSNANFDVRLNINPETGGLNISHMDGTSGAIYHTGMKPTKTDVGLGNVQNYGASTSVSLNSGTTLATSSAVKQAYDRGTVALNKANEAFQSASSGKTAIATAITGKGVATSSSDTFTTMATKIKQIETNEPGIHMPYKAFPYSGGGTINFPCIADFFYDLYHTIKYMEDSEASEMCESLNTALKESFISSSAVKYTNLSASEYDGLVSFQMKLGQCCYVETTTGKIDFNGGNNEVIPICIPGRGFEPRFDSAETAMFFPRSYTFPKNVPLGTSITGSFKIIGSTTHRYNVWVDDFIPFNADVR